MSTNAERAAVSGILQRCEDPCIVDLGSHQGEDAQWMHDACLSVPRIVLVEADPRNAAWIRDIPLAALDGVTVIEAAIAAHTGTCTFHGCDNQAGQSYGSGSIRKPTGHLEHFPWCTFPHVKEVPCFTLDDIFKNEQLDHIDVLWVDIQGAERDMIAGGKHALSRTRFMMIEAEEVEFYEGQAKRPELLSMLPGWEVVGVFGENLLMRNENLK